MAVEGDMEWEGRGEECLPLTERTFRVLIQRYKDEAAAARAVAMRRSSSSSSNTNNNSKDMSDSCRDMTMAANYMEDLAKDAERLYHKLQAHKKKNKGGNSSTNSYHQTTETTPWSAEDVSTLRLLGFDVNHTNVDAEEERSANAQSGVSSQQLNVPNLDALLSLEKRMHALQLNADRLAAENLVLRDTISREKQTCCTARQLDNINVSGKASAPACSPGTAKDTRVVANSNVHEVHGRCDSMTPRDAASLGERRSKSAVADRLTGRPQCVIEDAFCTLRAVEACRRVRYHMTNACNDVNPVDAAVIQLLNDLDFPFAVHIRRLGPGGHYFIDQHVEMKLSDGQLLVRPWSRVDRPAGSTDEKSSPHCYEHLAKYLIHLYSPAMDLDKAAGPSSDAVGLHHGNHRDGGGDTRLGEPTTVLRHQHRELQRTLENRCKELQRYQRRLEADLPPASEVRESKEDALLNEVKAVVDQRRQSPRETTPHATQALHPPTSHDRVAHILSLLDANGVVPDLSDLSESELRHLKRTTLRRRLLAFPRH